MQQSLTLDSESAKIANLLFSKYSRGNGIGEDGLRLMQERIYGKGKVPREALETESLEEFRDMLDVDRDGLVTYQDLEKVAARHLSDFGAEPASGIGFDVKSDSRIKKINLSMSQSFQSFDADNLEIAEEIFQDYDPEEEGCIPKRDLPLVITDICQALGVNDNIDREALEAKIKDYVFETPGLVYWEEFEDLYKRNFNF